MIECRTITAPDGVVSAVRIAGANGPALVFVHGVGSTAAIWDAQLAEFADTHRCIAVELRGNGVPKPEPDPLMITREGYAADVLAALDTLGIERFVMVGCSLGGVVTFELWQHAARRLNAMVILGSFARYPDGQQYADGISAAVTAAGSMEAFASARAAKMGLPPERLRETLEQMSCKSVASYLAATQATWTGDYRSLLAGIDIPTLVACGEHDTIAPLALSQEIAVGIPGSELVVIPQAGHVANADAPATFNRHLKAFLERIEQS